MAHIFTLTRTPRLIPDTTAFALGPRVPDGMEWGQVTDTLIGVEKRQAVLIHCDDAAADALASKLLPGETYVGKILGDTDHARIKTAFATPSPDFPEARQKITDVFDAKRRGDSPQQVEAILKDYERLAKKTRDWHAGPLDEWHASYRTAARAIEDTEKDRRIKAAARDIVRAIAILGINVGLAWAMGRYGVALAMAVVTSDYFSGGDDADITGRTSDASGGGSGYTWAFGAGSASIVSGAVNLASGGNTEFYLSDMPNTADVDSSVVYTSGNFGALARINGASGTGYMAWRSWSLYRNDGWGAWNEIAVGSIGPVSSGNTLMCRCSGTTISRVNNGSVDGTTTSSSYTTGKAGIACYGSTGIADNFIVDDTGGGGGVTTSPWYYYASQAAVVR